MVTHVLPSHRQATTLAELEATHPAANGYRECFGCSRALLAAGAGFDWPCDGHTPGSTADYHEQRDELLRQRP